MIFERIVCGVDGSPAGFEALRQATLLRSDPARILAVTVCETEPANATRDAAWEQIRSIPLAEARILDGAPAPALLAALDRESATLAAVGTNAGVMLGSVATSLLQQAPCSVLVARGPDGTAWSPDSIVVGMDGSREALVSAVIAAELAERFSAAVRTVAAQGGPRVDRPVLAELNDVERVSGHPVGVLVDASRRADLVIVGSRGLRAFEALGSVSERVAHQARCSVLVVRPEQPREET
jgi:nucleotide-binding universal stress UspA family protein